MFDKDFDRIKRIIDRDERLTPEWREELKSSLHKTLLDGGSLRTLLRDVWEAFNVSEYYAEMHSSEKTNALIKRAEKLGVLLK